MKTNYIVLILTFVINIFMALSLNSFTSPSQYLPMMFLYFLSGLAAFLDKITFYKSIEQKFEEKISLICFCICFLGVCFYIANSLGTIDINFQCNNGTYKVLMQGIQNSFFTFNSINITPIIFGSAFLLPFAYLALCVISYLKEQGLTLNKVFYILWNNKLKSLGIILLSGIIGCIGIVICHQKYHKRTSAYGSPQYDKYFWISFIVSLCILYVCFFLCHKDDDLSQRHYPEKDSYNTEHNKR